MLYGSHMFACQHPDDFFMSLYAVINLFRFAVFPPANSHRLNAHPLQAHAMS